MELIRSHIYMKTFKLLWIAEPVLNTKLTVL